MTSHGFDITDTSESVDVRRDPRPSTTSRFYGALFIFVTSITALVAILFFPGKHGAPSMWQDFSSQPISSGNTIFGLCILAVLMSFLVWFGVKWSLAAWPTDDALHCDRHTFTVSRVNWLDTQNRLIPQSFSIDRISNLRFTVVARAKGSSIYGLRFLVDGKKQSILAGLQAPEAATVLKALKSLGVDIEYDGKLEKQVQTTLEERGDTSWMDRSWTEHK